MPDYQLKSRQQDYLEGLDDEIVGCLGDHHPWKKLSLRDGVEAEELDNGSWEITVPCPDCGRQRFKVLLPNGTWADAKWSYRGGPKPKQGLGLTRRDYSGEHSHRLAAGLAQRPQPRKRAPQPAEVPVTTFSG
jgi:hypothetical protein